MPCGENGILRFRSVQNFNCRSELPKYYFFFSKIQIHLGTLQQMSAGRVKYKEHRYIGRVGEAYIGRVGEAIKLAQAEPMENAPVTRALVSRRYCITFGGYVKTTFVP